MQLFKGKMKILENLRLELDGSRRQHIQLENKIAKAEAKSVEVDPKHAAHIQSKDASVAGALSFVLSFSWTLLTILKPYRPVA